MQGKRAMQNRQPAFTGPDAEQRAERCGHFFRALAGNDASRKWNIVKGIGLQKAVGESGDSAGGFLAPVDFDDAVIAVRDTVGAFRNADVRPSRSVNEIRPRRVGGVTANFVVEGGSIPESQLQFDAVEASLKKLAILARSSTELWEDSAADLGEFLAQEIGYAFAATEDDCGFNGDGTSTYSGIAGLGTKLVGTKGAIAAASGHNTFLTLDSTDLANLVGGVLSAATSGASWYISAIGFAQCFCRLAAANGGIVWLQDTDGVERPRFLGFPVVFSAKLPSATTSLAGKPMLYFGNLKMSSVLIEQRVGTIVAASFDRYLDSDQVLIRGTRREDIINHLGSGTSDTSAATTYPPVAMLTGTT